ncbi:MAG: hypothetical protein PHQ19_05025 [Candidatus Krumholzibacteria bacterium]|nr:hypothetical protein [Candidatus Krumholzibacteria bacterium]
MRTKSIVAAALAITAAVFFAGGCEQASNPTAGDRLDVMRYVEPEMYGLDTLTVASGMGECGGDDPAVLVMSPGDTMWQAALIGGGGPAPACSCTVTEGLLEYSKPVTTRAGTDSLGTFMTEICIPEDAVDMALALSVVADDGAEVYLNGNYIGTVDLFGGGTEPAVWSTVVTGDSLFKAGTCSLVPDYDDPGATGNVLEFHLVNTGTGAYGEAAGRADTADCMYVQFEAALTWLVPPQVTIDIKPGSDVNPINCTNDNGVVPVAILTTDGFDAAAVDHTTVRFGPWGAYETHSDNQGMKRHVEDVDQDGDMDLVFHFRRGETGIACGDTIAVLWGTTFDGYGFEASDHIRTVPPNADKKDQ